MQHNVSNQIYKRLNSHDFFDMLIETRTIYIPSCTLRGKLRLTFIQLTENHLYTKLEQKLTSFRLSDMTGSGKTEAFLTHILIKTMRDNWRTLLMKLTDFFTFTLSKRKPILIHQEMAIINNWQAFSKKVARYNSATIKYMDIFVTGEHHIFHAFNLKKNNYYWKELRDFKNIYKINSNDYLLNYIHEIEILSLLICNLKTFYQKLRHWVLSQVPIISQISVEGLKNWELGITERIFRKLLCISMLRRRNQTNRLLRKLQLDFISLVEIPP